MKESKNECVRGGDWVAGFEIGYSEIRVFVYAPMVEGTVDPLITTIPIKLAMPTQTSKPNC